MHLKVSEKHEQVKLKRSRCRGLEKDVQQLRVLASLAEDPGLVLKSHIRA